MLWLIVLQWLQKKKKKNFNLERAHTFRFIFNKHESASDKQDPLISTLANIKCYFWGVLVRLEIFPIKCESSQNSIPLKYLSHFVFATSDFARNYWRPTNIFLSPLHSGRRCSWLITISFLYYVLWFIGEKVEDFHIAFSVVLNVEEFFS